MNPPSLVELLAPLPGNLASWLALGVLGLPLLSFGLMLAAGKKLPRQGDWLATGLLALSFLLSLGLLQEVWVNGPAHWRFTWFELPGTDWPLRITGGLYLNRLAALMAVMVTFITTLVHLFSQTYMRGDRHYDRYFAYLGLFCFAMLGIVLADNLLFIYMSWELVGLSSYLLIGFWFEKNAPARASQKAFLVNRVGDLGFFLGLLLLFVQFGTLDLTLLPELVAQSVLGENSWQMTLAGAGGEAVSRSVSSGWLTASGILLFLGAVGKSAQFPLQVWLPDAMAGPTPVSSLIHAATMVAAGIYLLARIFVLLSAEALAVIAAVGALTALMAAIAALTQWDIKRVLAYSTISQLGYMVLGMGVGAYDMALFHLFTHAFFKCALFLSAGAIIHQLHHQPPPTGAAPREIDPAQDLRLMGGLRHHLPWTFRFYLPPMLALSGLPLFSGFLSKDGILLGATTWAGQWGGLAWLVPAAGFLTAGLTAFYMARHALFIFGGKLRWPGAELSNLHDPDWKMSLPLGILAVSSLWPLFSLNPFDGSQSWLARSLPTPETALPAGGPLPLAGHSSHLWVAALSVLLALGGLWLGYRRFRRWREAKAGRPGFAWRLSQQHFFLDPLYDFLVVRPGLALGRLTAWVDQYVVDGLVRALSWATVNDATQFSSLARWTRRFDEGLIDGLVNLVGYTAKGLGRRLRHLQSGQLQRYLMYVLLVLGAASLYALWTWLR